MIRKLTLALLVLATPTPGLAQSATGGGVITIERSLSMATVRPMRLEAATEDIGLTLTTSNLVDAPAMIQITGDPGRVYRIRLPEAPGDDSVALVEDLRIWSVNDGDISDTRVARLDVDGKDLLRISGEFRLRVGEEGEPIAALPLSIDYE
jgi:hypothetical protein